MRRKNYSAPTAQSEDAEADWEESFAAPMSATVPAELGGPRGLKHLAPVRITVAWRGTAGTRTERFCHLIAERRK